MGPVRGTLALSINRGCEGVDQTMETQYVVLLGILNGLVAGLAVARPLVNLFTSIRLLEQRVLHIERTLTELKETIEEQHG